MKHESNPSAPSNAFVLVVMESNADWPTEIDAYDVGCDVLKQEASETYAELVRRASARVAAIEGAGGVIRTAILSCSEDREAAAFAGRAAMAHVLLQPMRRAGAELRIVAPAGTAGSARQPFVALAGRLTEALAGSAASVHLRFPERPTPRGSGAARRRRRSQALDGHSHAHHRRMQVHCS